MMDSIEKDFPEINNPDWIEHRTIGWQLALEQGGWKKEYRKKELEQIRLYFFTGKYDEEMVLSEYWGNLLQMFPIQSPLGYEYFYKRQNLTKDLLESFTRSAFVDLSHSGQDETAQLSYWDYHLGEKFQSKMIRITREGPVEIDLDPVATAKSIFVRLTSYLNGDVYSDKPKWVLRTGYFFSVLQCIAEMEGFIRNDNIDYFRKYLSIIITRRFPGEVAKDDYRFTFAEDFERRMEETEDLPVRFLGLWKQLQKEAQS